MNLGAQATARAADCLIFRPPFLAPAACWWARTMVESTIRYSKSGSSDIASKIRLQTPLRLHRLKRRNTLFHSPNTSGRSRQGEPVRTIQSTPSTNIRLALPVEPFWSGRPMIDGAERYVRPFVLPDSDVDKFGVEAKISARMAESINDPNSPTQPNFKTLTL